MIVDRDELMVVLEPLDLTVSEFSFILHRLEDVEGWKDIYVGLNISGEYDLMEEGIIKVSSCCRERSIR